MEEQMRMSRVLLLALMSVAATVCLASQRVMVCEECTVAGG
jgi:hypothetical protein